MTDDQTSGQDAGGRAHTSPREGHPDLDDGGAGRSDRQVGGPVLSDDERGQDGTTTTGGAHGDRPTEGHEPHE
jgi:hypothetical protein